MKPLEPPDSHHLNAALGWFELGNPLEANEELERITPENRVHPDVLQVRWQIYAHAKKWEPCVDIATAIIRHAPNGAVARLIDLARWRTGSAILILGDHVRRLLSPFLCWIEVPLRLLEPVAD